jgi:hypothetical protein
MSSLTSTNVNVREASQRATTDLIVRCHDAAALQSIVNALIKTLKDGRLNAIYANN